VLIAKVDWKRMCKWWVSHPKIQRMQPKNKLKQIRKGKTRIITYKDSPLIKRKYFLSQRPQKLDMQL
jgi:hypothetical protein